MATRAFLISSSPAAIPSSTAHRSSRRAELVRVNCSKKESSDGDGESKKKTRIPGQSLLDALDFTQVRSNEDAELLEEATEATRSGERMTREQYGALRRKIGGTYKDFFKSYVEGTETFFSDLEFSPCLFLDLEESCVFSNLAVEGQYVEEGWVDKKCRVCKKDTRGEPRQVDKLGRYVHVACLDKPKSSNFFTRLFSS